MSNIRQLNLRGMKCPMNFVRAKIAMESQELGAVLEFLLDDGEACESVPRSLMEEGHEIVSLTSIDTESWSLVVRKQA